MNINIWTDGSCLGNPGPMGYGVILQYKDYIKKISGYCGKGTSQRAEIHAFIEAIRALKSNNMNIIIHTDSQYLIGCLSQNWKWKKNIDLLIIAKQYMDSMSITFNKVKGHSDNLYNEECDTMAKTAASMGAISENTNNNNTNNNNIMHNNV